MENYDFCTIETEQLKEWHYYKPENNLSNVMQ